MEPIELDPETRKRPIPASETTVHDANPPRKLRAPASPPDRPWLMPAVGAAVAMVVLACMAIVYRMGVSHGTQDATLSAAPPSAAPTRVLLLDPVCKKAVDPNTAPAVLDFGGKSIYFDSLECLNAFRSDPVKYGAGRIRVHISEQTERPPPLDPSSAPSPAAAVVPDAAPTPDAEMSPKGPPERAETDEAGGATPRADASPGDASLDMPDPASGHGSKSGTDAPPVTESPVQLPPDLPEKAPPAPDAGDKKGKPAPKAAPHKAPPEQPKAAPPADNGDGFTLPPELREGPPSRKKASTDEGK